MRIDHLTLRQFRGFEALDLDLHPRCTVLAGVNGAGKSSVLDGLAVALGAWLLGFDEVVPRSIIPEEVRRERFVRHGHAYLEPQYPVRVEAAGVVQGRGLTWARELRRDGGKTTYGEAAALRELAHEVQRAVQRGLDALLPAIAYYGAGRLWVQKRASRQKEAGLSSRTLGYQDALDAESSHKLFEAWMKQQEQARLQRLSRDLARGENLATAAAAEDVVLRAVARTAASCVKGAHHLFFDIGSDELRVAFEDGREQSFGLLSDGYRSLVALAADLAWRAVRLNPHLGASAPAAASGVVLIDEVELHLHPAWQRTVLQGLTATFPNIQFVVTTHSPQVLASVPADQVRFLDEGGRVHRVGISEGLDTNTVLRDLMDVPERPRRFAEKLAAAADAIDDGRLEEARQLVDELAGYYGPDDPNLTALEWELRLAKEPDGATP